MDTAHINAAINAAKEMFLEHVEDPRNAYRPLLITPTLLKALNNHIEHLRGDVAFLDFNFLNPLLIPTGTQFQRDVWVVQSVWKGARDCTVNGEVGFLRTRVEPLHDFRIIRKLRTFDTESWDSHLEARRKGLSIYNTLGRVYGRTGLRDAQEERFMAFHQTVPAFSFIDYVQRLPDVGVVYNKNDNRYTIDGNVVLQGPYRFDIPDNTHFTGDLTLYGVCHQPIPSSTTIDGKFTAVSYF